MASMSTQPALSVDKLTKRFGGSLALDNVSMTLRPGEVHGLAGENGAGKSTLIKLLAGIYTPDSGRIEVAGHEVSPHLTKPSIAFLHQDPGLVDELTIGENIAFTAGFPRRRSVIDWPKVMKQAAEAYERIGLVPPRPTGLVGRMLPAEKAVLGIVRSLAVHASIAVLDEPTASLPAPDVAYLLGALRKLRDSGTAILYVTHRLPELFEIADEITVLRGGRTVDNGPIEEFTVGRLVAAMLGREIDEEPPAAGGGSRGVPTVRVRGVRATGCRPATFDVHEGEILGLVGLRGAGQEHIGRAIAGAEVCHAGSVVIGGAEIGPAAGLRDRMRHGIALLPADRQRESTFSGLQLTENLFPGDMNPSGSHRWIARRREAERAKGLIAEYAVRPPQTDNLIDQLSGGNQQKVCVARVLAPEQKLIVLEEPTAGVDVGSKFDIHGYVRDAARAGTAVIIVSSDFEEVSNLCTRALIVVDGEIVGDVGPDETSVDRLTVLAASGAPAPQPNVSPALDLKQPEGNV